MEPTPREAPKRARAGPCDGLRPLQPSRHASGGRGPDHRRVRRGEDDALSQLRFKDELILAFLERREELWTRGWLQAAVEQRAQTPGGRLLAIFDTFGEWFAVDGFEGCSFINVMLELPEPGHPVRDACVQHLEAIRGFLTGLAEAAGVEDPDAFARQWHILMKGSIVAATEGDMEAAARARELGALLLERDGVAT